MRLWMMLMFGLVFSVPLSTMAGSGTHLSCLRTCDPNFSVSVGGSDFIYSVENDCTRCCDAQFANGNHYYDCAMACSQCKTLCKYTNNSKNLNIDCNAYCDGQKEECLERNKVEMTFFCTGN